MSDLGIRSVPSLVMLFVDRCKKGWTVFLDWFQISNQHKILYASSSVIQLGSGAAWFYGSGVSLSASYE